MAKKFHVFSILQTTGHTKVLLETDDPAEALERARHFEKSGLSRVQIGLVGTTTFCGTQEFAKQHNLR